MFCLCAASCSSHRSRIELRLHAAGEEHPDVATTYNNMAQVFAIVARKTTIGDTTLIGLNPLLRLFIGMSCLFLATLQGTPVERFPFFSSGIRGSEERQYSSLVVLLGFVEKQGKKIRYLLDWSV